MTELEWVGKCYNDPMEAAAHIVRIEADKAEMLEGMARMDAENQRWRDAINNATAIARMSGPHELILQALTKEEL